MDDEDEGVITAGALVTVDVELTRKTLKVCAPSNIYKCDRSTALQAIVFLFFRMFVVMVLKTKKKTISKVWRLLHKMKMQKKQRFAF